MTTLAAVFVDVLGGHHTWRPGGHCVCGDRLSVDGITKGAHDEAHRVHVARELIAAGQRHRVDRLAEQGEA